MVHRIDHALVMDTDHLRGGGGYAVHAISSGAWDAERVFIAENFAVSDFLHEPRNSRFYLSVFRIPNGRTAFMRRFANGTRRNGVQNRIFVHTLFLSDALVAELSYLPWLLTDANFRIGSRGDPTPLTDDPQPLLQDPGFPALEWDGHFSSEEAFGQISMRFERFGHRLSKTPELAHLSPQNTVAAVVEAVGRRGRAALPQGVAFEQLSLLAWSTLPPLDRATLGWTQHDTSNLGGVAFGVANAPIADDRIALEKPADLAAQKTVELSTKTPASWLDFQNRTKHFDLRIGKPELGLWLRSRAAREALIHDPLAPDHVLLPPLKELAQSIRADRRDPWVDETEIMAFLWSMIVRAIEAGQTAETAVKRWVSLFDQTGIGEVIFRQPPAREWLDTAEAQIGVDLLIYFFVAGTEQLKGAAATRETITAWLLERNASYPITVTTTRLAQLIQRLAVDQSERLTPLIELTISRPHGLRELAGALPEKDTSIGKAVLLASLAGLNHNDPDTALFVRSKLLPQLEVNSSLGFSLPEAAAKSIGHLLRDDPAGFTSFATRVTPDIARQLTESITDWVRENAQAALPVARKILERFNEHAYPQQSVAGLTFAVAETGEAASLWLPFVIKLAEDTDKPPRDAARVGKFHALVQAMGTRLESIDPQALQQILILLQQHAYQRVAVGPCVHALVDLTSGLWSSLGDALPNAVEQLLAQSLIGPATWEATIMAIVAARSKNNMPSAGAAQLVAAFWERANQDILTTILPTTPATLVLVDATRREKIVDKWLQIVRAVPRTPITRDILEGLLGIAGDRQRDHVTIEKIKRLDLPLEDLLYLLDDALLRNSWHNRDSEIASFLTEKLRNTLPVDRAVRLVTIAASSGTWPTTRRTIETRFLPNALLQLRGAEWSAFLAGTGVDLFRHGQICYTVARYLASAEGVDQALLSFQQACTDRRRFDALMILTESSPPGVWEKLRARYNGIRWRFAMEGTS